MCHLSVSLVPNLRKTLQLPQSDLTPWALTLDETMHYSYVLSVPLLLGFEQNGSKKKVNFDFDSDETSRLMGEIMHCAVMPNLCVLECSAPSLFSLAFRTKVLLKYYSPMNTHGKTFVYEFCVL